MPSAKGPGSGPDGRGGLDRSGLARLGAVAVFACAMVTVMLPLPLLAGGGRPAWVERFPHDPDRYVGIGRADKRSHPDAYREMARDAALARISREISVEVTAGNLSIRREDALGWEEAYSARIATTSRNALTGYSLEGVYETQEEFWAYYVLDKEVFRAAAAAKEQRRIAWLQREVSAVDSDLAARRIQPVADRLSRMRAAYEVDADADADSASTGDVRLRDRPSPLPDLLAAVTGRAEAAVRNLHLVSDPAGWVFSLPNSGPPIAEAPSRSGSVRRATLSLVDAETGAKWAGPFAVAFSMRARPEIPPCRVETDAEGRLDPARAFLDCGLRPGAWDIAWEGPDGGVRHLEVTAVLRKIDLALAIDKEGAYGNESAPIAARLPGALAGLEGRGYRIVPGIPSLPVLEIRLREVTLDSLEGLYFSSIRAEARLPGMQESAEVRGKAGHANKDRARARAIRDFARALQGL